MRDYEKCFRFSLMAAYILKKDVDRWIDCGHLAKNLRNFRMAIYCFNRAIKQTSLVEDVSIDKFLSLKFQKIEIYKM
jgi:hypothetical protein